MQVTDCGAWKCLWVLDGGKDPVDRQAWRKHPGKLPKQSAGNGASVTEVGDCDAYFGVPPLLQGTYSPGRPFIALNE